MTLVVRDKEQRLKMSLRPAPGPNVPNRCGNHVAFHQHYVSETGSRADPSNVLPVFAMVADLPRPHCQFGSLREVSMDGGRQALRPEPPVRFCCLCRLEGGAK